MSESQTIILPWPPKELSPNARVHWAQKSIAAKSYRRTCWGLALESGVKPSRKPVELRLTFNPPSVRFDDDNAIGAFKNGRDGLADAWKMNDRDFVVEYKFGEPIRGGRVTVEIVV